jgi:hypothetical protein
MNDFQCADHVVEFALDGDHPFDIHAYLVYVRYGHGRVGVLFYRVDYVALFADYATDVVVVCQHFQRYITATESKIKSKCSKYTIDKQIKNLGFPLLSASAFITFIISLQAFIQFSGWPRIVIIFSCKALVGVNGSPRKTSTL